MTQTLAIARNLVEASRARQPLAEQSPEDTLQAYAIQQAVVELRNTTVGGWKIGLASPDGPGLGSALPANGLFPSGATLPLADYSPGGLELEIAFRFKRSFAPRAEPWSDEEVYAGIGSMAATLEVVASRYDQWPKVSPLAMLADLLNHGALIVGEFVEYREDFPFLQPQVLLSYEQQARFSGTAKPPFGDPRRLLPWLVNHYRQAGLTLTPDVVITTGSYTGLFVPDGAGVARGQIDGLSAVSLRLE